ncbi:intradiol ring-cleavage dioxygenase [Kineococcus gypseus]|uniref:intradiol ring-cleavage dioxygenase n=1 Tax=Kineococcus gypseus TaxID=1637102 RepID=UPI003D7DA206
MRTYQGRVLPRQDEDVDDQGLTFDLATARRRVLERRRVLSALGLGALGLGLAACGEGDADASSGGSSPSALSEVPDETAGPYPADGSNGVNVLTASGVVRSDIRSSFGTSTTTAAGVPMTLTLDVVDVAGGDVPFTGAAVYVWHCDRDGKYSLYSEGVEDEDYLRGVQVADADGRVTFTSVFPACYSGRWPHVHFEVYPDVDSISDAADAIATSQLALPQEVCEAVYATAGYERSVSNLAGVTLAGDGVFGDDSAATQLATVTGDTTTGYAASLTVGVDTRTAPTAGSAPGGGPGGGGPAGAPPGGRPASA